MNKPKAYSYVRISHKSQKDGDGIRRQLERSEKWALEAGLELDTTLQDIGISAFDSSNRRAALGQFLRMVELGKIPTGSTLIVESLDRLSRDAITKAMGQFLQIIGSGITVVTLMDNRTYTQASADQNPYELMGSLGVMARANEESRTKSDRVSKAWANKQRKARESGEIMTRRCPWWLTVSPDKKSFQLRPDRVATVRRIFEEAAQGIGIHRIAQRLNADKVPYGLAGELPTPLKGWTDRPIYRVLTNHAAIGWLQSVKRTKKEVDGKLRQINTPVGEPMRDYYPPVVDLDLFTRAQAALTGRKSPKASGRRGEFYSNLFSGLCRCATCGGSVVYRDASKPGYVSKVLRCNASRFGQCDNKTAYHYLPLEAAALDVIEGLEVEHVQTDRGTELAEELASKKLERQSLESRSESLLKGFEGGSMPRTVVKELRTLDERMEALEAAIEALEKEAAAHRAKQPDEHRVAARKLREAIGSVSGPELFALRAHLAQAIREIVSGVRFEPDGTVEFIVLGGYAGYWFKDGTLVGQTKLVIDLVPGGYPGVYATEALTKGDPQMEKALARLKSQENQG